MIGRPVPFETDSAYGGFAEVKGQLRFEADELVVEFQVKDAIFGAKSIGPLGKVVRTTYGWHVIVLTEIIPGQRRTMRDVEDEIRARLSQKKRFEKLVETVSALEAEGLVEYDDRGVGRLMSMSGLPKRTQATTVAGVRLGLSGFCLLDRNNSRHAVRGSLKICLRQKKCRGFEPRLAHRWCW